MEEFRAWFVRGGGIIHPDVEMADNSTGFYLRARSEHDIAAGSPLISCPHSLIISWPQLMHGPDQFLRRWDLQRASRLINEVVISRFFLIRQYLLKENSYWWPYIRSLPQPDTGDHLDTPLWYGSDELVWIQGTPLEFAAKEREKIWRQEYEEGMNLLIPAADEPAERWSWSWPLYKWAATIFSSRSFPGTALAHSNLFQESTSTAQAFEQRLFHKQCKNEGFTCPVLIPGLDMMNHNPAAKVTWIWALSECGFSNNEVIPRGRQIWNNYGPKSNEELIMGYGFSLFRNSADLCGLVLSSESRQRLMKFKTHISAQDERDREGTGVINSNCAENSAHAVSRNQLSYTPDSVIDVKQINREQDGMLSASIQSSEHGQGLHWVRLNTNSVLINQPSELAYEFSPSFLGDCSKIFSNAREIAQSCFYSPTSVDFSDGELSRNKFHVICIVTMMLQKKRRAITQHNYKLPGWPESTKAFHAARYRRNQVQMLGLLTIHFLHLLRRLVGTDSLPGRDRRLVRLEHILTQSPQGFLVDFRAALHAGLGTRNPDKIRSKGWVECTFTLWLCGLWLWKTSERQGLDSSRDPIFASHILSWLCFLERVYGHPDKLQADEESVPQLNDNNELKEPTQAHSVGSNTLDPRTDSILVAKSYLAVVEAAVKKNPHSLYNNPDVTLARLVWCLNIITEEGVTAPNLEETPNGETDEFILFMELDAPS